MANNKHFKYRRVRFQNVDDTLGNAVYIQEGTVRQTGVLDGNIDSDYEFTYIYSADGTPRKIPAISLGNIYTINGTLSSDRILDTNGKSFAIKGLTFVNTNLDTYKIMLQDNDGNMKIADADQFKNNVNVTIEW